MIHKIHPKYFFTRDEMDRITHALGAIESQSTGKIQIYLEWRCSITDPFSRAIKLFHQLKLNKHKHQNAVLIYLVTGDRLFAIAGGRAVSEKVSEDFWLGLKILLEHRFGEEKCLEGILLGIEQVGMQLIQFFPKP